MRTAALRSVSLRDERDAFDEGGMKSKKGTFTGLAVLTRANK